MEKSFITNRHGLKIAIEVSRSVAPTGLAFVTSGWAEFKEKPATASVLSWITATRPSASTPPILWLRVAAISLARPSARLYSEIYQCNGI